MATKYYVCKRCHTCEEDCETIQVDTLDPNWVPSGHEGHDLDDLVVDGKETSA